jgi:two-component system sensor histidine kinase DegS
VAENVYRIMQEALANVAAHAKAGEVEVTMKASDELFQMTIRDSGIGFDEKKLEESARLGILGMRERVELLNGRFELQTAQGQGTEIRVSIPLADDRRFSSASCP